MNTMNLSEWLAKNRRGTFSVFGRRVGSKAAFRRIEVPQHNHQDIWVWFADRRSAKKDRVDARIDRRLGHDRCDVTVRASDYEVFVK